MIKYVAFFLTFVFLSLCSALSSAQRVAIVSLKTSSQAAEILVQRANSHLEKGLRSKEQIVLVVDKTLNRDLRRGIPKGCRVGPCLAYALRKIDVDWLVSVGISVLGSSHDIVLNIVDVKSGQLLVQKNRRCDVCNFIEVGQAVERIASEAISRAIEQVNALGRINFRKDDLEVWVDGYYLGDKVGSVLLTPGMHMISIIQNHYMRSRYLRIEKGATTTFY